MTAALTRHLARSLAARQHHDGCPAVTGHTAAFVVTSPFFVPVFNALSRIT